MNKEELKKKIIEVLEETEYEWTEQKNGYILQIFYDKLADVLIAAGIGDVKERKFEADHYWSMWQGSLVELERAEHRAEVAEQALLTACVNLIKDEEDNVNNVNMELLVRVVYDKYLKQAEKELAEEWKDD